MDWYVGATDSDAGRRLRQELTSYLRRHAVNPDQVWEAELAIDELVGNALQHADSPVWVSVDWSHETPVVDVHDLGGEFELAPQLPDDEYAEGGRGLYLVAHLTHDLELAAKRAGGKKVSARLPIRRSAETSFDPPRRGGDALPALSEARPEGGFSKEAFLRALVVQLAQAVELVHGPSAAQAAVAQVGADVGGQMEEEYRRAHAVVGTLAPEQLADCYVRLKHAIDGDFYVIEADEHRIVLGNRRCPFGDVVRRAPALCRMTSSVFGGIAAQSRGEATVVLEERIAVGDPECRVVVHLGAATAQAGVPGHRYQRAADRD